MGKIERDEMEREAYDEMRFEMRGEGLSVGTFEEWKEQNARMRKLFRGNKVRNAYGSASEAARGVADGGVENFE